VKRLARLILRAAARTPARAVARRLLPRRLRRALRRASGDPYAVAERFVWTPEAVADATGPAYNVRCYLERRGVRELLSEATGAKRLPRGVEIGCGYGRLTMILTEFCDEVIGLEREEHLLETARTLLPEISFVRVPTITRLPLEDRSTDVAMTFTVLQHLTDDDVRLVLDEVTRIVRPGGWAVLMEKTDPSSRFAENGDFSDGSQLLSIGRSVDTYAEWLEPLRLVAERPGRVEPTYPGHDRVGSYMLFRSPDGSR
jgi:SAM-dependent methyltransferase